MNIKVKILTATALACNPAKNKAAEGLRITLRSGKDMVVETIREEKGLIYVQEKPQAARAGYPSFTVFSQDDIETVKVSIDGSYCADEKIEPTLAAVIYYGTGL